MKDVGNTQKVARRPPKEITGLITEAPQKFIFWPILYFVI